MLQRAVTPDPDKSKTGLPECKHRRVNDAEPGARLPLGSEVDRPLAREVAVEDHLRDMREPRPEIFGMIEAHVREDCPLGLIVMDQPQRQDSGIDFGTIDVPLIDSESFPRFGFLDVVDAHGGVAELPAILAEPCRQCRTDEPCCCAAAGVDCECTCGRCRFPGVLSDDGPCREPRTDARAAANGMGC